MILASSDNTIIIFLIVLGVFALIAIIAFIIYKVLHPKLKSDSKPSEEQIASEELNRVLRPIDDKDVARKVTEYKDEEDEDK